MVEFGNRSGPPIVDQLSARDGPDADVKFNSEQHNRNPARTGEQLRMRNSTAKTGRRPLPGPSAAHSSPAEVGSFSSPGRRSPTRVLAGVQQATALVDAEFDIRLLHPRQNPGRASPARRGERPDLSRTSVRCAGPGKLRRCPVFAVEFRTRSCSPVRAGSRSCCSLLNFTSVPDPSRALN